MKVNELLTAWYVNISCRISQQLGIKYLGGGGRKANGTLPKFQAVKANEHALEWKGGDNEP